MQSLYVTWWAECHPGTEAEELIRLQEQGHEVASLDLEGPDCLPTIRCRKKFSTLETALAFYNLLREPDDTQARNQVYGTVCRLSVGMDF